MYRPQTPFTVALALLTPKYTDTAGVREKTYTGQGEPFFGSFRSFGGTERTVDNVYVLEDTAVIETWYRPDIKANCRVQVRETGEVYEILGTPEDIELRHQFLRFKVRNVRGGA